MSKRLNNLNESREKSKINISPITLDKKIIRI